MPNKQYESGRRWEYKVIKDYKKAGWGALRTAGSHGDWDIIAWDPKGTDKQIHFVQCKVVATHKAGERLVEKFRLEKAIDNYCIMEILDVWVKEYPKTRMWGYRDKYENRSNSRHPRQVT